jgi:hypothetical protein
MFHSIWISFLQPHPNCAQESLSNYQQAGQAVCRQPNLKERIPKYLQLEMNLQEADPTKRQFRLQKAQVGVLLFSFL